MRSSVRRMYSSRVETRSPRGAESGERGAESSFMFCGCVRKQHVSCCDYLHYGTGPSGAQQPPDMRLQRGIGNRNGTWCSEQQRARHLRRTRGVPT